MGVFQRHEQREILQPGGLLCLEALEPFSQVAVRPVFEACVSPV